MSKLYAKGKEFLRELKDPWWRAKKKFIKIHESTRIDDHMILLEASHGAVMNGNMFYLLRYLSGSEKYRDYTIYLSAVGRQMKNFREKLDAHGMENVQLVMLASEEYFRILNTAKYLFNDTTFSAYFLKKEGQVYFNTWHGTPLKALGRRVKGEPHVIANVQKNLVSADYILFPNGYTRYAMIDAYMLDNISRGSYIMSGYPRNEIFFDRESGKKVRRELELEDKRVYAYLPTYRGAAQKGFTSKNSHYLNVYLYELDKRLQDNEVLYLNLHPMAKKDVNFKEFTHIRNFPAQYETYAFLNAADVLVTDYSSVFYDFACTGKKIVLFTYDKEEYLADRGMYMSMDELPFPQVTDPEGLLAQLRSGKNYDDRAFLERFCKYENPDASQKLCDRIILGEDTGLEVEKLPDNGKENVLLYAGNLDGNGITASLRSLLRGIDLDKRNYYICFYSERVSKHRETLLTFPEKAKFYAFTGEPSLTIGDILIRKAYRCGWLTAGAYMKLRGKREAQNLARNLGGARFHQVVQFNGYEQDVILDLSTFNGPRTIFVHSDMVNEIKTKGNQRRDVLRYAYRNYDHVAVVTEDIVAPTLSLSGREDNIRLVRNLISYQDILAKSEKAVCLDPATRCTVEQEALVELLRSDREKFINVGRFAPEKGHDRLVAAFGSYHRNHPESVLIIMGGSSRNDGYQKLWEQVERLGLTEAAVLIENVSNPYPIIKACDFFVLSSLYEGFGLVLAEADILGLPVVSTDITGPRLFMQAYGGTLVENSEAGILEGMELLHAGKVPALTVDYAAYNREAVAQFEEIMSTGGALKG